jgi:hypothetical protein
LGPCASGDAYQIRGYCGPAAKTAKALASFAVEYADQTDLDYREFLAAIKKGSIKVAESAVPAGRRKTAAA